MTTPQPKPLEFWIYHPMGYKDHETYPYYGDAVIKDLPVPIGFDFKLHVIEYSAYVQLRADLDEAIVALEYIKEHSFEDGHTREEQNHKLARCYYKSKEILESLRKRNKGDQNATK